MIKLGSVLNPSLALHYGEMYVSKFRIDPFLIKDFQLHGRKKGQFFTIEKNDVFIPKASKLLKEPYYDPSDARFDLKANSWRISGFIYRDEAYHEIEIWLGGEATGTFYPTNFLWAFEKI